MIDPLHSVTYAIADPHGCLGVLDQALSVVDLSGDAHLYLLGDYVPHETADLDGVEFVRRCSESLNAVRAYGVAHPGKVTVLPGNHELMLWERVDAGELWMERGLLRWLQKMLEVPYRETERQVFVHAGVDEEAGEWWRWGSDPAYFLCKFPPSTGAFEKDVIAGHVGTHSFAGFDSSHGVFWDGESHYYLDASTERSGRINVLRYDAGRAAYSQNVVTAGGASRWSPVGDSRCM